MNKIIYSLWLAQRLCHRGCNLIETRPNPKKPWLNCFVFKNTPDLEAIIEQELAERSNEND